MILSLCDSTFSSSIFGKNAVYTHIDLPSFATFLKDSPNFKKSLEKYTIKKNDALFYFIYLPNKNAFQFQKQFARNVQISYKLQHEGIMTS